MKRILTALLLFHGTAFAQPQPGPVAVQGRYDESKLHLLSGFYAKELCTCLFVVRQTEEFCRNFVGGVQLIEPHVNIDYESMRVTAITLVFWKRAAELKDPAYGCSLD